MDWIRTPETLAPDERRLVGGKAFRLARLDQQGFTTPPLGVSYYQGLFCLSGCHRSQGAHRPGSPPQAFEAMR